MLCHYKFAHFREKNDNNIAEFVEIIFFSYGFLTINLNKYKYIDKWHIFTYDNKMNITIEIR